MPRQVLRRTGSSRWSAGKALALVWVGILAARAPAQVAADVPEAELEFFESKVRPLLAEHCHSCHSDGAKKVKGGLKLDTRAALMSGGVSGAVVVPGRPEESELVLAVRYDGPVQMPPAGKLAAGDIALLEEWVRRGAHFPDGGGGEPSAKPASMVSTPWSFAPLARPPVPEVANDLWCRNEIDAFVLRRLEESGLEPAPDADRRTLLRRLSFDLTGLPPTAEELEAFERDLAPDAWSRQIERLLASPHYGERWGRYWLDLARYSDSNGLDENLAMSNAYRYRDWVVRALNQDLSYDQFLTWQLAGDLLPEPVDAQQLADQLTATAFLVLGPKMLAEQDKEKLVVDVVDEQLDVAFRTFQGLTVGCARCHDHKFDPLSQRDYTALAGIFKSTATMANLGFVSRWNERPLVRKVELEAREAHAQRLDEARKALEQLRAGAAATASRKTLGDIAACLLAAERASKLTLRLEAEDSSRGNLIRDAEQYGSAAVVIARTGKDGQQFAEYDLTFERTGRARLEVRYAAKETRPVRVSVDGHVVAESALGAVTGSWNPDGQRWAEVATFDVRAGRNVLRIERDGVMPHLDQLLLVPALEGGEPRAWPLCDEPFAAGLAPELVRSWATHLESAERLQDPLFALWSRFAALEGAEFEARAAELTLELRARRDAGELAQWNALTLGLLDGLPPQSLRELAGRYQALFVAADRAWTELVARDKEAKALPEPALDAFAKLVQSPQGPMRVAPEQLEALFTPEERAQIAQRKAETDELERTLPPKPDNAPAVRDADKVADLKLFRRGSHLDPVGEPVPRGAPAELANFVAMETIASNASGRLELARWMVAPGHPLTARVAANRVWQGHFGRGIVASSSNFGSRGDVPTHPELLDWLATELVARGWSMKALHRLVCESATYRMACDASESALAADPANRLLARQNRRRLDAESLRDALLAATGQLDRTLGGTLLMTNNGDYVTNDQSANGARYDLPRRSIYLPIIRNALLDLFSSFDYPDPSVTVEARPETTSPSQALYLMNSPLVVEASRRLLALATQAATADRRVDALYVAALGRHARTHEVERALRFVARASSAPAVPSSGADIGRESASAPSATPDEAWRAFAQVLLVSNEFLYVD